MLCFAEIACNIMVIGLYLVIVKKIDELLILFLDNSGNHAKFVKLIV